ncbi:MAG: hypothetical protein A3208_01290 [Candidatus Methanoprimaticola hominis]|nr:MAG: hypothetical protein A3208_01290 [Methanomassiliicoccales archaeon Mx-06]
MFEAESIQSAGERFEVVFFLAYFERAYMCVLGSSVAFSDHLGPVCILLIESASYVNKCECLCYAFIIRSSHRPKDVIYMTTNVCYRVYIQIHL